MIQAYASDNSLIPGVQVYRGTTVPVELVPALKAVLREHLPELRCAICRRKIGKANIVLLGQELSLPLCPYCREAHVPPSSDYLIVRSNKLNREWSKNG